MCLNASFWHWCLLHQLGARCALIVTAMLMTINKGARRNLGLGHTDYMLVIDWFSLVNIMVLALLLMYPILLPLCMCRMHTEAHRYLQEHARDPQVAAF